MSRSTASAGDLRSPSQRAITRFVVLAAAAAVVAAVPVLGLASPAQAHNYLVASTPAAGETLTELPEEFSITTNEALLDLGGEGSGFGLQVKDADGLYYGDGCVSVTDATMSTPAAIGAAGTYTVIWQVVSADGHTVDDEFTFTWAPIAETPVSAGSSSAPVCGTTPDSSATAAPEGDTPDAPTAAADADLTDVLWIGGAVVAVGIAIAVTLVLTSRKKK
ncbi:MAG: copper resistance protein CopC [Glaciihabitans sp.]|nr:copper resistance protein CopC [Glaciihabitans sp.]